MKNKSVGIAAAILAGGNNSRMGGFNKAYIRINGIPIIESVFSVLDKIFDEIILVTNSVQDFKLYDKKAVITEDVIKGIGPLGGIHSGLSATSKKGVFFIACDMPFLHNAFIRRAVECFNKIDCDCVVPRIGHCIEPLSAIYKKGLKDDIAKFARETSDRSIRAFLKTINTHYLDLEDNCFNRSIFRNLNTKEDLENLGVRSEGKI